MSNMPHGNKEYVEPSQIWSTTFTVKCGWWAGRKVLKLVKKYNALCAFRTGFNEIVFTIRGDDTEHEIYKLLLQNGAKEINMTSGMFNL
jgi:hypothetical protein